jgi:hypothetical protein
MMCGFAFDWRDMVGGNERRGKEKHEKRDPEKMKYH